MSDEWWAFGDIRFQSVTPFQFRTDEQKERLRRLFREATCLRIKQRKTPAPNSHAILGDSALFEAWFVEWERCRDAATSHFFHADGYERLSCNAHVWFADAIFFRKRKYLLGVGAPRMAARIC